MFLTWFEIVFKGEYTEPSIGVLEKHSRWIWSRSYS